MPIALEKQFAQIQSSGAGLQARQSPNTEVIHTARSRAPPGRHGGQGIQAIIGALAAVHGLEEGKRSVLLPANGLLLRLARNAIYEQAARIDSLVMHTRRDELAAAVHSKLNSMPTMPRCSRPRVVIRALTTDPAIEKAIQESVAAQRETRLESSGKSLMNLRSISVDSIGAARRGR